MKNLNGFEWIIILVIVVLLFGANKLPGLAKGLGESIKIFRKEVKKDAAADDAKKTKGEDAPKS